MSYIYVLAGWEGSAADSMVWDEARSTGLAIPPESLKILHKSMSTLMSLSVEHP
ncbi:hypothetical protein CROQUDRAFT_89225 [Cronartium quercuum f. sp. fusiforme G11]|uniref:Uncharacterized protein n=1 Tax=Cronartium quercuum f. sp. fusiforme G11 TaxID=708437 RepID=A0A9P6NSG9_9BASI|nr:hypothetical protein CROQUDRAFT_89225 [Cronartium quercuum f. sp. fusiforme G11]